MTEALLTGALVTTLGYAALLAYVRAARSRVLRRLPQQRESPSPAATPSSERERRRLRVAQLPGALESIAASVRAGASLRAAIDDTGSATPPPLGPELTAVAARATRGQPLSDAIDHWAREVDQREVAIAATALVVGARTGGTLGRVADNAAATLRDRAAVAGEVRALATQARLSAGVLAAVPPGFAALGLAVDGRTATFLLATPAGLGCLVTGCVLEAAGIAWMARITRAPS